jgi:hypothetical protein
LIAYQTMYRSRAIGIFRITMRKMKAADIAGSVPVCEAARTVSAASRSRQPAS